MSGRITLVVLGQRRQTKARVDGIADHLRGIAQAWAAAELQDLTKEDAEYYL